MTVFVHDDILFEALDYIKQNAERIIACAGAPATYAEATTAPATGKALADVAAVPGDFTIGDGATDGRKISWPAKTGVAIDDAGTADHVALVDDTNSKLLLVVPGTGSVVVTAGGPTATIGAGSYTIRDATQV